MYDKGPVPGRNDACWCGSGKKYKKCHSAFDERLERLWEEGWEVLPRTLYKTPADIEGIKRSAAINVGVLDYVGEHIAAGMTTNQIDQMIYDYTVEHGGTPADLQLRGLSQECVHLDQRRRLPRYSLRYGRPARGRHHQRGLLHDLGRLL